MYIDGFLNLAHDLNVNQLILSLKDKIKYAINFNMLSTVKPNVLCAGCTSIYIYVGCFS